MAAFVLPVIGCDDHLIPQGAPFRDEGGQHLVHDGAGVVHFLTVVEKAMPHAVQRAGVQHSVVQPEPQRQIGEGAKQIHIRRGHLVHQPVAGHRVKPPVVDRVAIGFVVFHIAHIVEGVAIEELRPERMGHGPCHTARRTGLGEDVLVL